MSGNIGYLFIDALPNYIFPTSTCCFSSVLIDLGEFSGSLCYLEVKMPVSFPVDSDGISWVDLLTYWQSQTSTYTNSEVMPTVSLA